SGSRTGALATGSASRRPGTSVVSDAAPGAVGGAAGAPLTWRWPLRVIATWSRVSPGPGWWAGVGEQRTVATERAVRATTSSRRSNIVLCVQQILWHPA